jgi:predicted nucleic acid-binding protein
MTEYKKYFVDTSIFIYLLEENKKYNDIALGFFDFSLKNNIKLSTSAITYFEFCVKPYEINNFEIIEKFKSLLIDLDIVIYGVSLPISDLASRFRAKYKGLKSMDALQIASAVYGGNEKFITNDKRLSFISDLEIILLEDWKE